MKPITVCGEQVTPRPDGVLWEAWIQGERYIFSGPRNAEFVIPMIHRTLDAKKQGKLF